jgi:hypothetical protein
MDDLNGDNFDHTGLGFIRGAVIFASNGNLPIGTSRMVPPSVPGWGSAYKKWLHEAPNLMVLGGSSFPGEFGVQPDGDDRGARVVRGGLSGAEFGEDRGVARLTPANGACGARVFNPALAVNLRSPITRVAELFMRSPGGWARHVSPGVRLCP